VHILTKILVVLVALLIAALVPLAAVSSTNQSVYKLAAADAQANLKKAEAEGNVANDAYNASIAAVQAKVSALEAQLRAATMERDKETQMRADKERDLERVRIELADLKGQVAAFSANDTLQTKLIDAMRQDIEGARTQYLAAEKARVELQDSLARIQGDLDSETAAKRQLQEQLQKVSEEKERAMADVQRYAALHGSAAPRAGATSDAGLPVVADRSLSATVIDVKREPDATLAEINVGSRDGVKEGWVMTIADGSNFVGNLRIVQVDVNRAVGVVELEDSESRGEVKSGQRAIARKGQ
jgi:predicted  nucleic acid-binding Zn-ribbon protein